MYHILPKSKGNVIGIRIENGMCDEDYEVLLPFIKSMIQKHGTIRVLSDVRNLKGFDLRGFLKALSYTFKYGSKVEKKAVITNQKWIRTWLKFFAPFFKTEIRCFRPNQTEKAWAWVNE